MQEISQTATHTLTVDTHKNRIYFTALGSPLSQDAALLESWNKAIRQVSQGFTVLADISQLHPITRDWAETSVNLQHILIEAGLAGTAELLSRQGAATLKISRVNKISRLCYTKEELFTDKRLAEAWLDKISA